jgi:hypothetical protein
MSSKDTEEELNNALAELIEFSTFFMEMSKLSPEEMARRVEERDPSFIEHLETMEEPPKSSGDFWSGFCIWTITRLRWKYSHIWHNVTDAYFHSDLVAWEQTNEILKNSNF